MTFCPCCGFNLTRDEVMELDGFMLDPRGMVAFQGSPVLMTHHEAMAMHTVASAKGRPVKTEIISQRISDGEDPHCASVFLHRVRRKLAEARLPNPIETVARRGYRWSMPWVS